MINLIGRKASFVDEKVILALGFYLSFSRLKTGPATEQPSHRELAPIRFFLSFYNFSVTTAIKQLV